MSDSNIVLMFFALYTVCLVGWGWIHLEKSDEPDLPDRDKLQVYPLVNRYTLKEYYPRYLLMAIMYKDGFEINDIAERFNVTRERVRQCLWKVNRRRMNREIPITSS